MLNPPFHKTPKLSIIIPAYNAENFIEECINSINAGDSGILDIVIIDDGSTDGTKDIILKLYKKYKNISYTYKANDGCASARNLGIIKSKSTHLAFVDSDDFVDKNFFQELFALALDTKADIVHGEFDLFTEQSNIASYRSSYEDKYFELANSQNNKKKLSATIPAKDLIRGQPAIWRKIYKKSYLLNNNLWFEHEIKSFDDWLFHNLSTRYTDRIPMLFGPKYHYRQHQNQDIKNGDRRHFYIFNMIDKLLERSTEEKWDNFIFHSASFIEALNFSLDRLDVKYELEFCSLARNKIHLIRKKFGKNSLPDKLFNLSNHRDKIMV